MNRICVFFVVGSLVSCSSAGANPREGASQDEGHRRSVDDLDRLKARTARKMGRGTAPAEDKERQAAEDAMRRARNRKNRDALGPRDDFENFTEDDERAIGDATARAVLARFRVLPMDHPATVYVRKVGAVLSQNSSRPEVPYRFAVIVSKSVNAFAAPYGYVFITTGALRFVKNEAELALILAHEIAHVEQRHGLKQIARAYLDRSKRSMRARLDELSAPLEGDAAKARDALRKKMDRLSDLIIKGYGLPEELEADRLGLRILSRAGYDPSAAAACLARLAKSRGGEDGVHRLFRSHPKPQERYAAAVRAVAALPAGGAVPRGRFREAIRGL